MEKYFGEESVVEGGGARKRKAERNKATQAIGKELARKIALGKASSKGADPYSYDKKDVIGRFYREAGAGIAQASGRHVGDYDLDLRKNKSRTPRSSRPRGEDTTLEVPVNRKEYLKRKLGIK